MRRLLGIAIRREQNSWKRPRSPSIRPAITAESFLRILHSRRRFSSQRHFHPHFSVDPSPSSDHCQLAWRSRRSAVGVREGPRKHVWVCCSSSGELPAISINPSPHGRTPTRFLSPRYLPMSNSCQGSKGALHLPSSSSSVTLQVFHLGRTLRLRRDRRGLPHRPAFVIVIGRASKRPLKEITDN